jgi:leucyl aminopeptidase
MEIRHMDVKPAEIEADAVVVGVFQGLPLAGAAAELDAASAGLMSRLVERGEITGKRNEVLCLFGLSGVAAKQVVVVGWGEQEKLDRGVLAEASGTAAKKLAEKKRGKVVFCLEPAANDLVEAAVCGVIVGCQGQDLFRAEKKLFLFDEVIVSGGSESAIERGRVLGECTNFARRLVNGPPQEIYPDSMAEAAAEVAGRYGIAGEIWDEDRLQSERCGALLAVARGSVRPPRLVILRYEGGWTGDPPLTLVGKGVTFDSGGLSLKPTDGMLTMKCDMAGAATVLGAMQAIARLALPINVTGVLGLVENMVSGNSYKLGDVLTARNGRTIEVQNTDAEGRLVLADALAVAVDRGAAKIVDLATLTGACVVALGNDVAGAMTNDQPWCDQVLAAGRVCGEPLWQLPMYSLYDEHIKSSVADIRNVGEGRWGGAIAGAKFLEQFVGKTPWVHLDIAGPAFRDKAKPFCDAGASGQYLRTLVELARGWGET